MADPRRVREQIADELLGNWLQLSDRQRAEARQLVGDPPDLSLIPQAMWEKWRREEEAMLFVLLFNTFANRGLALGLPQDRVASDARAFASTQAFLKSTQFSLRRQQRAAAAGDDPAGRLDTLFGRKRAESIVETESTTGMASGAEFTIHLLGLESEVDTWRTNPSRSSTGPCQVCSDLHGTPRRHWAVLFPYGPPAHGNCVCDIQYANVPEG